MDGMDEERRGGGTGREEGVKTEDVRKKKRKNIKTRSKKRKEGRKE